MKTTPINVEAVEITDAPALDPIRVILQDISPGQGRIIVECFGQAWSNYWGGLGKRTVRQFVNEVDPDYLAESLYRGTEGGRSDRMREYVLRIAQAVKTALAQ